MGVMRSQPGDLKDTCMFYTQIVNRPPEKLSRLATQLACQLKKYSISVSQPLWQPRGYHFCSNPLDSRAAFMANRKNEEDGPGNLVNYYGIFDPKTRSYQISQITQVGSKPPFIEYFENISRVMARVCTGKIYVLSQTPDDMGRYANTPNIWNNVELLELRSRLGSGDIADRLVAIDATDTTSAWEVDWKTLVEGLAVKLTRRELWKPYNMSTEIKYVPQKRCDGHLCLNDGLDDEPANLDFFGLGGYVG
jgi:hypothetical protein